MRLNKDHWLNLFRCTVDARLVSRARPLYIEIPWGEASFGTRGYIFDLFLSNQLKSQHIFIYKPTNFELTLQTYRSCTTTFIHVSTVPYLHDRLPKKTKHLYVYIYIH